MKRKNESINNNSRKLLKTKIIDCQSWVSASALRNYMLDDPLIDWLKHTDKTTSSKNSNSNSNSNTVKFDELTEFIMNKGCEFEDKVYNDLLLKFPDSISRVSYGVKDIISCQKAKETRNLMYSGVPIIYNGVVHNPKNKTYGAPDLIVRSDWINKICSGTLSKKEEKIKASKLNGKYHYRIIDIKYSQLKLKADGNTLLNSGSTPAYKAQVYVYSEALNEIQGYNSRVAYILGRGYKYTSKGQHYQGDSCYDKLAEVDFKGKDKEYVNKANDAIRWIKELRTDGHKWKIYPTPTRDELYPNMSNSNDSPYTEIKREIATKLNEITMIWQCGPKHRELAFDQGIYSWKDKRCTALTLGHKGLVIGPIVQKMLEFNRTANNDLVIPSNIINRDMDWHRNDLDRCELFLDLEWVSNIFDNLNEYPRMGGSTVIFLIGVGYLTSKNHWNYKSFRAKTCDYEGEKHMLENFVYWMKKTLKNNEDHIIYHWSMADQTMLNSAFNRHPDVKAVFLKYFDMFELFKKEPILIKGNFNFGLKSVINSLSHKKLIDFKLSKACSNGEDAMVKAWKCYSDSIKIDKNPNFTKILQYNEEDCKSLYEILKYLRLNHVKE